MLKKILSTFSIFLGTLTKWFYRVYVLKMKHKLRNMFLKFIVGYFFLAFFTIVKIFCQVIGIFNVLKPRWIWESKVTSKKFRSISFNGHALYWDICACTSILIKFHKLWITVSKMKHWIYRSVKSSEVFILWNRW